MQMHDPHVLTWRDLAAGAAVTLGVYALLTAVLVLVGAGR